MTQRELQFQRGGMQAHGSLIGSVDFIPSFQNVHRDGRLCPFAYGRQASKGRRLAVPTIGAVKGTKNNGLAAVAKVWQPTQVWSTLTGHQGWESQGQHSVHAIDVSFR